jgi:hypothetical protein
MFNYISTSVENSSYCHNFEWLQMEFSWQIRFIDHLQILTTSNYNTTTDYHTLQITTAHVKSFQYAASSPIVPW